MISIIAVGNQYARVDVVDYESSRRGRRGRIAQGRWFDLWTGAVAVDAMCFRSGKAGWATFPNDLRIEVNNLRQGVRHNSTQETETE